MFAYEFSWLDKTEKAHFISTLQEKSGYGNKERDQGDHPVAAF
jgi:hypothetical protein